MLSVTPGSDIMSKLLIADHRVKSVIVNFLEVRGTYMVVDNLFKDGKEADTLMIPQERLTTERPPILIEIQQVVNFSFTSRLIRYCSHIMERYGVRPLVVVFNVSGFQSKSYQGEFTREGSYFTTNSTHWAKKLFLLNLESIKDSLNQRRIPDIVMLAYFFCNKEVDINNLQHKSNTFLIRLYDISEEIFGTRANILTQYSNDAATMEGLFSDIKARTTSSFIKEKCISGIALASKINSHLLGIEKDDLTDLQFVELFKGTDESMSWSMLYNQGVDLGHFSRYKNHKSMRSAYMKGYL